MPRDRTGSTHDVLPANQQVSEYKGLGIEFNMRKQVSGLYHRGPEPIRA